MIRPAGIVVLILSIVYAFGVVILGYGRIEVGIQSGAVAILAFAPFWLPVVLVLLIAYYKYGPFRRLIERITWSWAAVGFAAALIIGALLGWAYLRLYGAPAF